MSKEQQLKYDKTRLRNLLRNYRDHIITKYRIVMKHIPIVEVIDRVDNAIKLISNNL